MGRRLRSLKRLLFSLAPLLFLLVAAELTCRIKFFFMHAHDWYYITAPFRLSESKVWDHSSYRPAGAVPAASPSGEGRQTSATGARGANLSRDSHPTQVVFKVPKPCTNRKVFSDQYQKLMDYTWDENCFRGDHVTRTRRPDEYRIFMIGGSTVEDQQSDAEMMTAQIKAALPNVLGNKKIRVINAGQGGLGGSQQVATVYGKVSEYAPDVVMYYEAFGEQVAFSQWMQVESRVGAIRNGIHTALFYRSLLYTYLVEKYAFSTTKAAIYWKIDTDAMRQGLSVIASGLKDAGGRFVFVTQASDFPRYWKGVDTWDAQAVSGLLDRLKNDRSYVYDVNEIGGLNQRLAVMSSIEWCRQNGIAVINVLDEVEALDEPSRRQLFTDIVHLTWRGNKFIGDVIGRELAGIL